MCTTPIDGTPARWSVGLEYRLALGGWWGALSASWNTTVFRGVQLTTRDQRVTPRLSLGARFWLGPVAVMPALAFELTVLSQESIRDDEAAIRRSYPALPVRNNVGGAVGPGLRLEIPVVGPLFASLTGAIWARALPVENQTLITFGADSALGLGTKW
jgi:hypothetical protein